MIVPDLNLLLYAYDAESPFQTKSAAWWQACLSGTETVLLPEVVAFGFVRVSTNARAFRHPMTATEAVSHVRSWLAQDMVAIPVPAPDHAERVFELLLSLGTAGNLVTDAQIAAVAMENEAVLHTADADFIRFKGLRWLNPLKSESPASPRKPRRT
jgi:toxin-antitoxin system PIN domain toxin